MKMGTPDFDVIKDIPGYKVILKAVLKSQIQQLVDHLAVYTEEESIILTASVADGTLSHLGSTSGKSFLDDHEDVKSQFLGFCLKAHHWKTQQESLKRQEIRCSDLSPRIPYNARSPRFMSPQHSPQSLTIARSPHRRQIRSIGVRHEPYPTIRALKRTNFNLRSPGGNALDGQIIKVEPNSDNANSNQSDLNINAQNVRSYSQPSSPPPQTPFTSLQTKNEFPDQVEDAVLESAPLTIPIIETPPERLSLDSDLSNIISETQSSRVASHTSSSSDLDSNVNIKIEDADNSEVDLEITGVESGKDIVSQNDWTPDVSMAMNFDPSGLMSYSPSFTAGDQPESHTSQQGYKVYKCSVCGKMFGAKAKLKRHFLIHTGEKPFKCDICGNAFNQKTHLNTHARKVHDLHLL